MYLSFSFGTALIHTDVKEALDLADQLMYTEKRHRKLQI
jgi:hypothetical protein